MLELLLSWIYIVINVMVWGIAFQKLITKVTGYVTKELDIIFMLGITMLTTYAQFFSVFHRVSLLANLIMVLADTLFIILWHQDLYLLCKKYVRKENAGFILFGIVLSVITAGASAGLNTHYDTELYHGQAIRWIEEYGVVKGLGNLMNNFAYNSSFFSLQALFSLKFLIGQSLRNVNGLMALFMNFYAVSTMAILRKNKFKASDLLKLMIIVINFTVYDYTSSSTDMITMLVAAYIFTKWFEYIEKKEDKEVPLAILCLFGVLALTLKLSSGVIILAAIQPVILFAKKKEWKRILFFLISGCIIVAPYLIRNVIISGYLLYPYASIDLFSFDWKMNKETVQADALQIMTWGKEMQQYGIKKYPFLTWFPIWLAKKNLQTRILLAIDVLVIPVGIIWELIGKVKGEKLKYFMLFITSDVCFLVWLFSAPLLRYGKTWVMLNACLILGITFEKIYSALIRNPYGVLLKKGQTIIAMLVLLMCFKNTLVTFAGNDNIVRQADYKTLDCVANDFNGITIYTPASGDQVGYQFFPATTSTNRFATLGLRTGELKDGFCYEQQSTQ